MFFHSTAKTRMVSKEQALEGRETPIVIDTPHLVLGSDLNSVPAGYQCIQFGMGCFWGAERRFWLQQGVYSTAVGYAGGYTNNPLYEEVCSALTGHTEVVKVVYQDSSEVLTRLLTVFWEAHDPTQGMRQGNDVGSQYRSAIFCSDAQLAQVLHSKTAYAKALSSAGLGEITTDIETDQTFYFAEEYHQQYLAKNPNGYCGLAGTGVSCVDAG